MTRSPSKNVSSIAHGLFDRHHYWSVDPTISHPENIFVNRAGSDAHLSCWHSRRILQRYPEVQPSNTTLGLRQQLFAIARGNYLNLASHIET